MIKKLLILFLFLGFSFGQDGRYKHINDTKRFDTKTGETEWKIDGKWMDRDEIDVMNKKNYTPLPQSEISKISFYDFNTGCPERMTEFTRKLNNHMTQEYVISFKNDSRYDITEVIIELRGEEIFLYPGSEDNKLYGNDKCFGGRDYKVLEVKGRKRSIFSW